MEDLLIHKRKVGQTNDTLCGAPGVKIYMSNRVTCSECLAIMAHQDDTLRIWLDDERPAPQGFVHVHTINELHDVLMRTEGPITVMSFDHDLGDASDGYDIIKWLAAEHLDRYPLEIRVHSGNTVGRENIVAYDRSVRKHLLSTERPA